MPNGRAFNVLSVTMFMPVCIYFAGVKFKLAKIHPLFVKSAVILLLIVLEMAALYKDKY